MSTDTLQTHDMSAGNLVSLRCGCRAAIEVRVPARPLCAVRIVAATCGSPTHSTGRRIMISLRSLTVGNR